MQQSLCCQLKMRLADSTGRKPSGQKNNVHDGTVVVVVIVEVLVVVVVFVLVDVDVDVEVEVVVVVIVVVVVVVAWQQSCVWSLLMLDAFATYS